MIPVDNKYGEREKLDIFHAAAIALAKEDMFDNGRVAAVLLLDDTFKGVKIDFRYRNSREKHKAFLQAAAESAALDACYAAVFIESFIAPIKDANPQNKSGDILNNPDKKNILLVHARSRTEEMFTVFRVQRSGIETTLMEDKALCGAAFTGPLFNLLSEKQVSDDMRKTTVALLPFFREDAKDYTSVTNTAIMQMKEKGLSNPQTLARPH